MTQNIQIPARGSQGATCGSGKNLEGLLSDGSRMLSLGERDKANEIFERALRLDPDSWDAWLGYASTGGDGSHPLAMIPAYYSAYNTAKTDQQREKTFLNMLAYIPVPELQNAFAQAFRQANRQDWAMMFEAVSGVIGCDETEIAALAMDLCPGDWHVHFAMAKIRQIRARWSKLEGNFFTGKHLPAQATDVLNIFLRAYQLAKKEGATAEKTILDYIENIGYDNSYSVFVAELKKAIAGEP